MTNSFYLLLPRKLQDGLLSIYGANIYRQRFHGSLPEAYCNDLTIFGEPTAIENTKQEHRLQALLSHCKHYIPYYKDLLRHIDTSVITTESLKDIVPIMTKSDVLNNYTQLCSTHPGHWGKLRTANTSGSSGTPLSVFYTDEARRINYKFYESALRFYGCNYRSKSTTLAGRILYKNPNCHPDRYDHFNNTQYLSTYFISKGTIESYVHALNKWAPHFIDSYPSALIELISLAQQESLEFTFSPKCILTSSENLSIESRSLIENTFRTKVIDQYGCTEMAINAFSNGGNYYSNPLYSVIELAHQFNSSYEVITTGLLNFGMPLLRYKIGDLVQKNSNSSNYIFSCIDGRADDAIVTEDGRRIGRMDPAFKGIAGLAFAQIIQEDLKNIIVKVVLAKNSELLFEKDKLVENIKERTGKNMIVDVQIIDGIERSANGKFKSVISKVNL